MKVLVISDIHGSGYYAKRIEEINEKENPDKIILLGDVAVGKTSILSRFADNTFNDDYKCNVSVEFKVKSIYLDKLYGADLKIWDTCGEEKFRSLTRQYYKDSKGKIKK